MGFEIFAIVFMVFVIALIGFGVRTVPQGYHYTVERFGRYTRTLEPGLAFIVPLIDKIGRKMNMMEIVLDVPSQEVISKDNATVQVDAVVFFQVIDAPRAAYEVNNLVLSIQNLAQTNLRSVMGEMDLDEMLSSRDLINSKLLRVIDEATQPWGVKVTRVEIKDISPPEDIKHAMNAQMKAERQKRADVLAAEADRKASIERAEGEKQAAILRAEGQKQAAILEAEGRREAAYRDAEAREREAQAEAEATKVVSEAVKSGDLNAVNYFVALRYVDAIRDVAAAKNSRLVLMPFEAGNVIGALGGIAELTKAIGAGAAGAVRTGGAS